MSDTSTPSKPFKQSDDNDTTQTLTTDHVLPATGNDASGNSYCEDSLDDKKDGYGFAKKEGEAEPDAVATSTSSPSPESNDTASPKKLNPTAATFIFQSKDGSKPGRTPRSSLNNSSPRGGHRQGGDGSVPRTPSFGGRGGGPSGRTPSSARPRGQTPVSSPSTPVSESTAATAGESSIAGTEGDNKQVKAANVPVNREPRGYVPPPPTKREKLSEAELEEKMARMRLVNAEALARSEAQTRDAEMYAAQAAKADQAAMEKEQERRRKGREEKERRLKEQGKVDEEREKARKIKLARLKAMGGGDEGGERDEEPVSHSRESGWGEQQGQSRGGGWNGGRGGYARRGDEDRSSWSDRRDRGGRGGDDREGTGASPRGGQGQAGRGRRGGRSDLPSARQSTSNKKDETAPANPEVEVMSKPVEPVGTIDDVEKAAAASWADS